MTNPAATMRLLITYGICIPLAMMAGYFVINAINSNATDVASVSTLGLIIALLLVPIFIRWHYPILLVGLGLPMNFFFLKGSPPAWEVVTIISFGIAIVERTMNSNRRFIPATSAKWAFIYTILMTYMTARLTGGIGLHSLGSDTGGGKKYISVILGAAVFFALSSQVIPKERRKLYLCLFLLAGLPAFLGDLAPLFPAPLNYIGLLIPATHYTPGEDFSFSHSRLVAFGTTGGTVAAFMMAWWGIRGIFTGGKAVWRIPLFLMMAALSLTGGHRLNFLGLVATCGLMFFLEGLHRTRLLAAFVFGGVVCGALLVPLAIFLPYNIQRSLTVVPFLHLDPAARADAEGSSDWRLNMWRDVWPKVPEHLLLGKGYAITAEDYEMMGQGMLANSAESKMDGSESALALSSDYHSGPLSTLMPFGVWGAISYIWLTIVGLQIAYRNYRYGDPELRIVNGYGLAAGIWGVICYLFVFGAYSSFVLGSAIGIGFNLALNGGVHGPASKPAKVLQPTPPRQSQPQPHLA